MPTPTIEQTFEDLMTWCRRRDFSGHDPFDALNSRLFQSTQFRQSRLSRLSWTQALKRSPINLRRVALVPAQKNSKGIALFALAALANYRRLGTSTAEGEARDFLDELLRMRIDDYSGAAWGYNFDWQSRNFFAPCGTPTIVPTAFAVRALLEGFAALREDKYLTTARSACDFILKDLNRPLDRDNEICFSYSPLDQTQIFNASLFAAETLASTGKLTGEAELCETAMRAARYVVRQQHDDGSWAYGTERAQEWIDSFHTAYVLQSLNRIIESCAPVGNELRPPLVHGYAFWRQTFFLADGWPKYYDDALYPADAHAAATAIVTLVELHGLDPKALSFAETVATWTIANLLDQKGFFYYQRRRYYKVRTPFMRWTQSWMAYALARLLEAESRNQ